MTNNQEKSSLRKIPNVGSQTEQDLIAMGYTSIASLKGKKAEDLYEEECRLRGCTIDRCQLYLYRALEYFVHTETRIERNVNGGIGKMIIFIPLRVELGVWTVRHSQRNAMDAER